MSVMANLGAAYDETGNGAHKAEIARTIIKLLNAPPDGTLGINRAEFEYLRAGSRLPAIKSVGERTGLTLSDAKYLVDSFCPAGCHVSVEKNDD